MAAIRAAVTPFPVACAAVAPSKSRNRADVFSRSFTRRGGRCNCEVVTPSIPFARNLMARNQPQPQTTLQTRRQRLQILHPLWDEPLSIAIVQESIVRKSASS